MLRHETRIALPAWIDAAVDSAKRCTSDDDKLTLAIRLAGLERRGIAVVRDVLRQQACEPLRRYRSAGGPVY